MRRKQQKGLLKGGKSRQAAWKRRRAARWAIEWTKGDRRAAHRLLARRGGLARTAGIKGILLAAHMRECRRRKREARAQAAQLHAQAKFEAFAYERYGPGWRSVVQPKP